VQDVDQFLEDFKTKLKALREERVMTVYRLAQESGLAPQTISGYEDGTRTPGLPYIFKLAKGFKMKPSEFLIKMGY